MAMLFVYEVPVGLALRTTQHRGASSHSKGNVSTDDAKVVRNSPVQEHVEQGSHL